MMELRSIEGGAAIARAPIELSSGFMAEYLAAACGGDTQAFFELGVVFSTGSDGVECDLIEAHKWFNLAAAKGHDEAAGCRSDVADEMTAREIAEAQRRARQWLSDTARRVA